MAQKRLTGSRGDLYARELENSHISLGRTTDYSNWSDFHEDWLIWVCKGNKVQQQIRSLLSFSKKHIEGVNKGSSNTNKENTRILEIIRMGNKQDSI